MNRSSTLPVRHAICFLSTALWLLIAGSSLQAQTFTVLHNFAGGPRDGAYPTAPLVRDSAGNLYGASLGGSLGWGTIFKVTPTGEESVLYNFQDAADGMNPFVSFVETNSIFGTTYQGGVNIFGTVFKLDSNGKLTTLYSCCTSPIGAFTWGVIRDRNGDLYGITIAGGSLNCDPTGCGTMFKLNREGTATLFHTFGEFVGDGEFPNPFLVRDATGNIYGTTSFGGTFGDGTIYKMGQGGKETIIYSFQGGTDGVAPFGGVRRDAQANLYGITSLGGTDNDGTVFKVTNSGQHFVLHSFDGIDGAQPTGGVILDSDGNIYGVTYQGGRHNKGTVFQLDAGGNLTVLHEFDGIGDGQYPLGVLLLNGALYGVTSQGGAYGYGTVFKLTP